MKIAIRSIQPASLALRVALKSEVSVADLHGTSTVEGYGQLSVDISTAIFYPNGYHTHRPSLAHPSLRAKNWEEQEKFPSLPSAERWIDAPCPPIQTMPSIHLRVV